MSSLPPEFLPPDNPGPDLLPAEDREPVAPEAPPFYKRSVGAFGATGAPRPVIWSDPRMAASFIDYFKAQRDHYWTLLEPVFQRTADYWKQYLLDREDPREENQLWRAFIVDPSPNVMIETVLQQLTEIVGSADPLIQGEGVGADDKLDATSVERNVDMVLRKNAFELFVDDWFRHVLIQGFQPVKVVHGRKTTVVRRVVSESDFQLFEQAVREAEMATKTTAPIGDAQAFELWRQNVHDASEGRTRVPEVPLAGPQEKVLYEGPVLERPSIYTLLFDPAIADWQKQPCIMQRFIVGKRWVEERTDWTDAPDYVTEERWWCTADPIKPFYGPAVAMAIDSISDEKLSEWESQIGRILGYDPDTKDPSRDECVELYECWLPGHPDVKHTFVLNREAAISKDAEFLEYEHGMAPWTNLRNVPLEGSLGMSEMKPSQASFYEHERLRELFLDAVLIEVMPILIRLSTGGLDDEDVAGWHPGMQLTANRPDALSMLRKDNGSGIRDILTAIGFLRAEQDDAHSTSGQVRGQQAPIGRVTADEARQRLQQALLRQKARVRRWCGEMQPLVYQIIGLLAQFATPEDLVNVGGTNPFVKVPKQRFYDALFQNFKLRGPLDHLNKIESADALMAFGKTFWPSLPPEGQQTLMLAVLRQLGVKEASQIVPPQALPPMPPPGQPGQPPPPGAPPPGGPPAGPPGQPPGPPGPPGGGQP